MKKKKSVKNKVKEFLKDPMKRSRRLGEAILNGAKPAELLPYTMGRKKKNPKLLQPNED